MWDDLWREEKVKEKIIGYVAKKLTIFFFLSLGKSFTNP